MKPLLSAMRWMPHAGFLPEMTLSEALKILGTGSSIGVDRNYRQLLHRNHPDKGGSVYLTQKLNEARALVKKQGGV
ncbi:DnaJ -like subfamily C member 19 [Nematocida displodere]|uniref:DnaJ-like subfamily C member 19 n=1 Tax=Nematocida displodere TaxID=1805483 RepID=A0A177EBJ1_9MICR|nr:DnaJ -like subfamily C member 19 [Nematocida displodere]